MFYNLKKKHIIISSIFIIFILGIVLYIFLDKYYYSVSSKKFESHRLGNVIDRWYLQTNIPDKFYIESMHDKDPKNKESFSHYLMKNLKKYTPEFDNYYKNKLKEIDKSFLIYHYERINLFVNDFHINLRTIMKEYDNLHNNFLFKQDITDENHCIIHYRLGDYVTLGDVIDYNYIISAMKELNINFSTIELMDGGKNHNTLLIDNFINMFKNSKSNFTIFKHKEINESEKIAKDFYESLKENFPHSNIIQSDKRTVDEDFYRIASAPILITAGGSFAIAAAIASKSRIIRTPSCECLDFPSKGCIGNLTVIKNNCDWKTYQYTIL